MESDENITTQREIRAYQRLASAVVRLAYREMRPAAFAKWIKSEDASVYTDMVDCEFSSKMADRLIQAQNEYHTQIRDNFNLEQWGDMSSAQKYAFIFSFDSFKDVAEKLHCSESVVKMIVKDLRKNPVNQLYADSVNFFIGDD